jgi:hypothetical protein
MLRQQAEKERRMVLKVERRKKKPVVVEAKQTGRRKEESTNGAGVPLQKRKDVLSRDGPRVGTSTGQSKWVFSDTWACN